MYKFEPASRKARSGLGAMRTVRYVCDVFKKLEGTLCLLPCSSYVDTLCFVLFVLCAGGIKQNMKLRSVATNMIKTEIKTDAHTCIFR